MVAREVEALAEAVFAAAADLAPAARATVAPDSVAGVVVGVAEVEEE